MQNSNSNALTWSDFTKVDMRVGTITSAEYFTEARNPAIKLTVDFGEIGLRKTSAQITDLYSPEKLVGKQVIAVVNFPPKQIATMMSECLILGAIDQKNQVTLLQPEREIANGMRIG